MTQHSVSSVPSSPENQRQAQMRELLEKAKSLKESMNVFPDSFHDDLRRQIEITGEEYLRVAKMTA
jgi:hypothetical protein